MKFDTTTIQGFDTMTAEEQVKAILAADLPDIDTTGYVEKSVFDAKASEAAKLSKQVRELQNGGADTESTIKELQGKVAALEREKAVAANKASLLALGGYDDKTAGEAAEALVDGNVEAYFKLQKTANEKAAQAIRADHVKDDPKPDGAGGAGGEDKMSDAERLALNISKARKTAGEYSQKAIKNYLGGK